MRFIFIYAVQQSTSYCTGVFARSFLPWMTSQEVSNPVLRTRWKETPLLHYCSKENCPLHHTKYGILGSAVAYTPGVFQNSGIEGQSAHINHVLLHVLRGKSTPLLPRAEVQTIWSNTSFCRTSCCLSALRRTCHARRTTARAKVLFPPLNTQTITSHREKHSMGMKITHQNYE